MFLNIIKNIDKFLCINILCMVAVVVLLSYLFRYSYIWLDDITDLIVKKNCFNHARFISLSLEYFLTRNIPFFFNINVQDFAFFSIAVPQAFSMKDLLPDNMEYDSEHMYLYYLKRVYGVDISHGVRFIDWDDAIDFYYKNGGTFDDDELKKLNFSKIREQV